MRFKFVLPVLIVIFSSFAHAEVVNTDEAQLPETKKQQDLPDSSPSSPPLVTDDPDTPGNLGVEVNFIGHCDTTSVGRACGSGIDANLGLGDYWQLRVEKEGVEESQNGSAPFRGLGSTSAGVKYRFFDNGRLKIAFYPSYQFDDETRRISDEGGFEDSDGRSLGLPLILSKQLGRYTLVFNAGYTLNDDYAGKNSVFTSFAIGRPLNDSTRIMAELTSEKPTNSVRHSEVRLGAVKEVELYGKSPFETAVFGSVGQSVGPTEDGRSHLSVLLGLTVARKSTSDAKD
jgi:hypothetical protein